MTKNEIDTKEEDNEAEENSLEPTTEKTLRSSSLKKIITSIFITLIAISVAYVVANIAWFYSIKSGSENLDVLKLDEATTNFEAAANLSKLFLPGDDRRCISLNTLSTVLIAQGKYGKASRTIDESLALHKKLFGNGAKTVKPILLKAGLNRRQGRYDEAIKQYSKALDLTDQNDGKNKFYSDTLMVMSILEIYRGNYDRAESGFHEVESINQELDGKLYKPSSDMTLNLGRIAEARGKYKTAEELYKKSLSQLGPENDSNKANRALALNLIAQLYLNSDKVEDAGALIEKAYSLSQGLSAKEYLQAANLETLINLTSYHLASNEYKKAHKILSQSLPIAKERLGSGHPAYAKVLSQKAKIEAIVGNFKQAQEDARKAIALSKETVGEDHRYVAEQIKNLADIYALEGNLSKAEEEYKNALAMLTRCLGKNHPEYAHTQLSYARTLEAKGSHAMANEQKTKARKILSIANSR